MRKGLIKFKRRSKSNFNETYLVVAAVPNPNVSDGGAADVVVCAPYGGALMPNVNPPPVVVVAGSAAEAVDSDVGAAPPKVSGAACC